MKRGIRGGFQLNKNYQSWSTIENNIEDADMDKFKQTKNQYQNSLNMLN